MKSTNIYNNTKALMEPREKLTPSQADQRGEQHFVHFYPSASQKGKRNKKYTSFRK
jgi:hypothetical protein